MDSGWPESFDLPIDQHFALETVSPLMAKATLLWEFYHLAVALLRLNSDNLAEQVKELRELVAKRGDSLVGKFSPEWPASPIEKSKKSKKRVFKEVENVQKSLFAAEGGQNEKSRTLEPEEVEAPETGKGNQSERPAARESAQVEKENDFRKSSPSCFRKKASAEFWNQEKLEGNFDRTGDDLNSFSRSKSQKSLSSDFVVKIREALLIGKTGRSDLVPESIIEEYYSVIAGGENNSEVIFLKLHFFLSRRFEESLCGETGPKEIRFGRFLSDLSFFISFLLFRKSPRETEIRKLLKSKLKAIDVVRTFSKSSDQAEITHHRSLAVEMRLVKAAKVLCDLSSSGK